MNIEQFKTAIRILHTVAIMILTVSVFLLHQNQMDLTIKDTEEYKKVIDENHQLHDMINHYIEKHGYVHPSEYK